MEASVVMRFILLVVSALCVLPVFQHVSSLTHCHRGTYKYFDPVSGTEICLPCGKGTFMPFDDHSHKECFDCMKIEDPGLEILISECNNTYNTIVHCVVGYYRQLPRNVRERQRCETCTQCKHQTLPCQTYENTHCCMGENFIVIPDRNGVPGCWELPWMCRKGQYFNVATFQCERCPHNTFMPLDYHSSTECFDCQSHDHTYLPKHSVISRPCNATQAALLKCKDGYFIDHAKGYQNSDIGCTRCKDCSRRHEKYTGRNCTEFNDTVCCPQPGMVVVDTAYGPECRSSPASLPPLTGKQILIQVVNCGEGQYLDMSGREIYCAQCPPGTFVEESSHTRVECQSCFSENWSLHPYCARRRRGVSSGCRGNLLNWETMIISTLIMILILLPA